jgi:hypothetical protein
MRHETEIQIGHEGRPTVSTQDERNGAGLPAADYGMSDQAKYIC